MLLDRHYERGLYIFCDVICVPVPENTPYNELYTVMIVEGSARKGYLFHVYERVGVSLVEVFEENLKKGQQAPASYGCEKRHENFLVLRVHLHQLKGMQKF